MDTTELREQATQIGDAIRQASVKIVMSQSNAFILCLAAAREIDRLRDALGKAQNYLSKVESYQEDIANEADYFCKVTIDRLLKMDGE